MRLLLLLVPLALLAGCFTPDGGDAGAGNNTTDDMPMATKTLAVDLIDRTPGIGVPPTTMGITPALLEAAAGDWVNLTVTNAGNTVHNLVIEGLDVQTDDLDPGASQSIEFSVNESGSYKMYCSIGGDSPMGHDAQGMHGELKVS